MPARTTSTRRPASSRSRSGSTAASKKRPAAKRSGNRRPPAKKQQQSSGLWGIVSGSWNLLARGAGVRVRVRDATNLVVHLLHRREVPRVAPHAVDEDEEMDVVARAALCFTHIYEAKSGREEGG